MPSKTYVSDRLAPASHLKTYDSQAPTNSDVIATGPLTFFRFLGINKAASGTLWIMFFDAAAVPANATVPLIAPIPIAGGAFAAIDLSVISEGLNGLATGNGLVWAASTTPATLTLDATSSIWMTARYYQ